MTHLAILHFVFCYNYYGGCCYYNTSTTATVSVTTTARRQYRDLEHRFWSQTAWVSIPIPIYLLGGLKHLTFCLSPLERNVDISCP